MRSSCLAAVLLFIGCGRELLTNGGLDLDCGSKPCDWTILDGNASFGASWHQGDSGVDLSGSGPAAIQQRTQVHLSAYDSRNLELEASIVKQSGVTLRFDLDWYEGGEGSGEAYWASAPRLVETRSVSVAQSGVFRFDARLYAPPGDLTGLRFRIAKDGTGQAIVDELSLHTYWEERR